MRHIIFLLTISFFIMSCGQTDTKQKVLDLKEKEIALKEKELQNKADSLKSKNNTVEIVSKDKNLLDSEIKENICDTKYQLSGKLIKVYSLGMPCAYPYLKIVTDDGKNLDLFLDGNQDNFKVNDKNLFIWSDKKITDFLDNDYEGIQFPNSAIELTLLNKSYLFCCYKEQLNCGDNPNAPKDYFCKKIIDK
ncbi:MAG: hypothetical protein IPP81_19980 [Chitinophagaceae bacterium]|nr:hypothetical protein [Chitinophagaceae bacterium]